MEMTFCYSVIQNLYIFFQLLDLVTGCPPKYRFGFLILSAKWAFEACVYFEISVNAFKPSFYRGLYGGGSLD